MRISIKKIFLWQSIKQNIDCISQINVKALTKRNWPSVISTPGNSLCCPLWSFLSSQQPCLIDRLIRNANCDDNFDLYSLCYPTIHQSAIMMIHISHPSEIQIKSLACNRDYIAFGLFVIVFCLLCSCSGSL